MMKNIVFMVLFGLLLVACKSNMTKDSNLTDGEFLYGSMKMLKAVHCEAMWSDDNNAKLYINSLESKNKELALSEEFSPDKAQALRAKELTSLRDAILSDASSGQDEFLSHQLAILGAYDRENQRFKLHSGIKRKLGRSLTYTFDRLSKQESGVVTIMTYHERPGRTLSRLYNYKDLRKRGIVDLLIDFPVYSKSSRALTYSDEDEVFYLYLPLGEASELIDKLPSRSIYVQYHYKVNGCTERLVANTVLRGHLEAQVIEVNVYIPKYSVRTNMYQPDEHILTWKNDRQL